MENCMSGYHYNCGKRISFYGKLEKQYSADYKQNI